VSRIPVERQEVLTPAIARDPPYAARSASGTSITKRAACNGARGVRRPIGHPVPALSLWGAYPGDGYGPDHLPQQGVYLRFGLSENFGIGRRLVELAAEVPGDTHIPSVVPISLIATEKS